MALWLVLAVPLLGLGLGVAWYARAADVATPAYGVETTDGRIEIRTYPALVAAEVHRPGDRGAAVRSGFGPLARYIFARDRPGGKIAMTAPVTQEPDPQGGWTVAFIMPEGWTLERLPQPAGAVRLSEWPAHRAAAIRFSGRWTDRSFREKADELSAWMAARGLEPAGPPIYAYYNDPFTPFFLRRNEVIIRIAGP